MSSIDRQMLEAIEVVELTNNPEESAKGGRKERDVHILKTHPLYFQAVLTGKKNFEIRKNDRGFSVGDQLLLKETEDESGEKLTGRKILVIVDYITDFEQKEDYVVMAISVKDTYGELLKEVKTNEDRYP